MLPPSCAVHIDSLHTSLAMTIIVSIRGSISITHSQMSSSTYSQIPSPLGGLIILRKLPFNIAAIIVLLSLVHTDSMPPVLDMSRHHI